MFGVAVVVIDFFAFAGRLTGGLAPCAMDFGPRLTKGAVLSISRRFQLGPFGVRQRNGIIRSWRVADITELVSRLVAGTQRGTRR